MKSMLFSVIAAVKTRRLNDTRGRPPSSPGDFNQATLNLPVILLQGPNATEDHLQYHQKLLLFCSLVHEFKPTKAGLLLMDYFPPSSASFLSLLMWGFKKTHNNPKSLVYVELWRKLKHMKETCARDATVWWKPLGRCFMRELVQKPRENWRAEIWAPETVGRGWLQTAIKSQFAKQRGRQRSRGVVFIRWQKLDVHRNTFL